MEFPVYRTMNSRSKAQYPLLLDVQADLLDELATRVVIPLTKAPSLARRPMSRLSPVIEIEGETYLLMTPQLAGISQSELGPPVANVAGQRTEIVAAFDTLISGV